MSAKRKGSAFENKVRQELEDAGFLSVRASNSIGDFDVLAISEGQLYGVECKNGDTAGRLEKEQWNVLWESSQRFGYIPLLAYRPRVRNRRPTRYLRLTGPKPGRPLPAVVFDVKRRSDVSD